MQGEKESSRSPHRPCEPEVLPLGVSSPRPNTTVRRWCEHLGAESPWEPRSRPRCILQEHLQDGLCVVPTTQVESERHGSGFESEECVFQA